VRVSFVTGASVFRTLKPNDFIVVADYNELRSSSSDKCRIYLKDAPPGISRTHLDITQVDYLIEEQVEE